MDCARGDHAASVLTDGKVLVIDGAIVDLRIIPSAELYDPSTGNWSNAADPIVPVLYRKTIVLHDGRVLVFGGQYPDPESIDRYPLEMFRKQAVSHSGRLPATGGRYSVIGSFYTVELYNPQTDRWKSIGEMHNARADLTVTLLLNGKVLAAGGIEQYALNTAELFDPTTDS